MAWGFGLMGTFATGRMAVYSEQPGSGLRE